jgi:hypothetical protein
LNGSFRAITSRSNRKKNIIITGSSRPLAVIRLPSICLVKNCPEKQTDIFLELLARLYLSITSNGVRAGLVPRRISTHFSTLLV